MVNPTPQELRTNLRCTVLSYARHRELHVSVNEMLVQVFPVEADRPTVLTASGVTLQPGANRVRWYTPYASDLRDGRPRTFALLKDSAYVGPIPLAVSCEIPVTGTYEVLMAPTSLGPLVAPHRRELPVMVDGITYRFPWESDAVAYGPTRIPLTAGRHQLSVLQEGCEGYQLILRRPDTARKASGVPQCTVRAVNPTRYQVHVQASGPHFLVFQESFHTGWRLDVPGGLAAARVKAQGYANGWWVPTAGTYDAEIRFVPQRMMTGGLLISGIALLGGLLVGLVHAGRGWRR
ncbi:MAG: hypothetical protein A3C53_00385 [Omnitrophica WOR_2 bacterium RIFCSPHIGHO2_02_FULL_68_15]|nr:MAG: hypothetical protein A3C53_00385 [Omnitrophica WOR_2 bacterium RIFCSPHIGHO2_02_FULL_68_15]